MSLGRLSQSKYDAVTCPWLRSDTHRLVALRGTAASTRGILPVVALSCPDIEPASMSVFERYKVRHGDVQADVLARQRDCLATKRGTMPRVSAITRQT